MVDPEGVVGDLKAELAKLSAVPIDSLVMVEVYRHQIYDFFSDAKSIRVLQDDEISAYEVRSELT